MRRLLIILLALLLVVLAAAAAFVTWALYDDTFLKDRVTRLVEERTGRDLDISGPFTLEPGRKTTLRVAGIRYANAAWADEPDMVRVGRLQSFVMADIPGLIEGAHRGQGGVEGPRDDRRRGRRANVRRRRDRGTVDVHSQEPGAGKAERAVDEYPDECAEQESGRLRQAGNLGTCADPGHEDVDQRRSHCRRIG